MRGDPGRLIGRAAELSSLYSMIEQTHDRPLPVLLRGAAGVGKTALLQEVAAAARAAGFHVLWATGVESEVRLPLYGLHQLLHGMRDDFHRLPEGQRAVLERALGLSQGPAPEQFAISATATELFRTVAVDHPLLVAVDDLQWIDQASARIIGFIARRLDPELISFIGAIRTDSENPVGARSFRELAIEPLPAEAAAELLDRRFPGSSPAVRARLLEEAGGNPLALLELPVMLTDEQLSGQEELPRWLSLSDRLESLYAGRVRGLPPPTRALLLLAALETTGSVRTIWSACSTSGIAAHHAVVPAERAGLIGLDSGRSRLLFRHPLVRSAIVQLASADQRRSAHRLLGEALDDEPERQIGHVIAGSLGPDETVAAILERASYPAMKRGSASASFDALRHASHLSPRPEDRSRRLALAAYSATPAGRPDVGRPEEVDTRGWNHASAGCAAFGAAFRLIHRDCDVRAAHQLLLQAIDHVLEADGQGASAIPGEELLDSLFHLAITASLHDGGPESWARVASRIEHGSESVRLSFDVLSDPVSAARTVGSRVRRAFDLAADSGPSRVLSTAQLAVFCDDLGSYREQVARAAQLTRTGGALADWAAATSFLALDAYQSGRWNEAEALLREGLEVAEECAYTLVACCMRYQLAVIEAGRGHGEAVRDLTDHVLAVAVPQGLGASQAVALQARALMSLGTGDWEAAYADCVQISPTGEFPAHVPWLSRSVLDVVEAAVMTGRTGEALAHVEAAMRADLGALSSRTALQVAGAAALAASDEEAGPLFEEALALPGAERWPFEHARIRLAFGQWLVRREDPAAAREHLRSAAETLERLGATPWVERAERAYRAAVTAGGTHSGRTAMVLTPRELEVAQLAASGLSNKQIGVELAMRQRTVSTHLYNIFPKLGVTSRAALRDALVAMGGTAQDDRGTPPRR
ncbi:AAA family ATPase [Streptomyces sp. ME03-5709C]|nr:AAA family ATPase [Streptomyces sp. ME03-5709C]